MNHIAYIPIKGYKNTNAVGRSVTIILINQFNGTWDLARNELNYEHKRSGPFRNYGSSSKINILIQFWGETREERADGVLVDKLGQQVFDLCLLYDTPLKLP